MKSLWKRMLEEGGRSVPLIEQRCLKGKKSYIMDEGKLGN